MRILNVTLTLVAGRLSLEVIPWFRRRIFNDRVMDRTCDQMGRSDRSQQV